MALPIAAAAPAAAPAGAVVPVQPAIAKTWEDFVEKASMSPFQIKFVATAQVQQTVEWPQRGFTAGCKNIRNLFWTTDLAAPALGPHETYAEWAEQLGELYLAATKFYAEKKYSEYATALRALPVDLWLNTGVDLGEALVLVYFPLA